MRRTSRFFAALLALGLALSPTIADARAGGGGSWGSRGSRTWSAPPATNTAPFSAQPMQRSVVPNAPSPGFGAPYAAPGLQPRSAFTSGLLGGLIGAGLGGLLLGHGLFGGLSGIGSFFGFLLQLLLIVFVVRWLIRRFRGGGAQPSFAGMPNIFARNGAAPPPGQPVQGRAFGGAARPAPAVALTPADYGAFEQILRDVQAGWSAADLNALRRLATPEMVGYFADQLADASSRGVRNTVTDVRLQKGDLAEAWSENGREFATVAMRFSMIDVTRDGSGRIVDGSPTDHVSATELWTFLRTPGGRWVLSAIQQAR